MTDRPSGARLLSEVALVLLHVVLVVSFDRLYDDRSFLGPLVGIVFAAHALAALCRWRGLRTPTATAVAVAGAVVVIPWFLFPSTTWVGLPTADTWETARASLAEARAAFPEVLAPTAVLPGFQLASALALWAAVCFADWAAFRLRSTVEATVPAAVIFVFVSLLGSGRHVLAAAAGFSAAALLYVAAHRALRAQLDQAWLATGPTVGPQAVLRAGVVVGALAVLAGAVAGPNLPGADADAVVDWRGQGGGQGPRVTISPMVELKKRLFEQSDLEVLEVRTDYPTYLRLTSLGEFDGEIFKSSGNYDGADDELESDGPIAPATRQINQEIRIKALNDIWVPAAFQLRELRSTTMDLRWESDSSTLIVDEGRSADGLTYGVVSEAPILDPDQLRAIPTSPAGDAEVDSTYLELPAGFPAVARSLAREVTQDADTRYDQARQLQDWFRTTFTYDLGVGSGHGDDALVAFLESRRGYCEQFAGAFAAMARTLGIPSRVAVGFTQGDQDPDDPSLWHVKGTHAHAWPELWFPTIGWVPFEPTPGRGMPGAEATTGAAPQQADEPPAQTTTTTAQPTGSTTPTATTTPTPSTTQPATQEPLPPLPTAASTSNGELSATWILAAAVGLLTVGWIGALLLVPVWRRRRAGTAAAPLGAWRDALDPVRWATGLSPRAAETHAEFADRAADRLGELAVPFRRLAELATASAWSGEEEPDGAADEARRLADTIDQEVRAREPRSRRWRRHLSWREAFGRPRAPTGAAPA